MQAITKPFLATTLLLSLLSACQGPNTPQMPPSASPGPVATARVELSDLRDSDVTDRLLHHEIEPISASRDGEWLLMSDYTSENAYFSPHNFYAQRVRKGGYTVLNRRSGEQHALTGIADDLLQAGQSIWLPDGRLAYLGPQNQWRAFDPRSTSDVMLYQGTADEKIQFIGLDSQTLLALAQGAQARLLRLDLASGKAEATSFASGYYSLSATQAADGEILLQATKSAEAVGDYPFTIATIPPVKQDLLLLGADGKNLRRLASGLDLDGQAAVSLSPDGRRVLIQNGAKLTVSKLSDGSQELSLPLSTGQTATWLDDGHLLLTAGIRDGGTTEPVTRSQLAIYTLADGQVRQSALVGDISGSAIVGQTLYLRLYHPDPEPDANRPVQYHFELVALDITGDLQPETLMSTAPRRDLRLYSFPGGSVLQALPSSGSAADRKIHLYSIGQGRPQEFYSRPGYEPDSFSFSQHQDWSACYCP